MQRTNDHASNRATPCGNEENSTGKGPVFPDGFVRTIRAGNQIKCPYPLCPERIILCGYPPEGFRESVAKPDTLSQTRGVPAEYSGALHLFLSARRAKSRYGSRIARHLFVKQKQCLIIRETPGKRAVRAVYMEDWRMVSDKVQHAVILQMQTDSFNHCMNSFE